MSEERSGQPLTSEARASRQEAAPRSMNAGDQCLATPALPATLLERSDLLAQLEASPARLVLLRAPAGFGKTTLLLQYRERREAAGQATLWYRLQPEDDDLETFIRHLQPGLDALLGRADDAQHERPAAHLLATLEQVGQPFELYLDEFEHIRNPSIHDFVVQMLRHLPGHGRLLASTRRAPDFDLGRLRAHGGLLEVGADALRLSHAETRRYLREVRNLPLLEREVSLLYEITEGWVTALYLAALSLQWHQAPEAFVASFSGNHQELAEYLAEDILARLDLDTRRFLLQTSILETLCAESCAALTGRDDSAAMLERLERANLFIAPLDAPRREFRYHPLFAGFLRMALDREYPGMARELHLDAARWYVGNGEVEFAIDHLLLAGALEEAADQLAGQIDILLQGGHAKRLLNWLEQLPTSLVARNPTLGIGYAWALVHARRYGEALALLERPDLADSGAAIRCLLLLVTDHPQQALQVSREAFARLTPKDAAQYTLVAFSLVSALFFTSNYDESRRLLSIQGLRDVQRNSTYLRNQAEALEALLDLVQGQLDNALVRLENAAARPWGTPQGIARVGYPILDISLSLALYEAGKLPESKDRLEDVLPDAKEHGTPDALIISHVLLARIAYENGDREQWMRYLADLDQFGHIADSPRVQCSSWLERARVAILEKRLDSAEHALRAADQLSDWDSPEVLRFANDTDTPGIGRFRLRVAQGDAAVAEDIRQALAQALVRHQLRRALKLRLLLAMALESLRKPDEALQELGRALAFAARAGFVSTFLEEGADLARLLERWSVVQPEQPDEQAIRREFVARLCRRPPMVERAASMEEEAVQDLLSPRELQVLRLLALGYRNREIAEKMYISELTVKTHLRKINGKLGSQGRTQALSFARARKLID